MAAQLQQKKNNMSPSLLDVISFIKIFTQKEKMKMKILIIPLIFLLLSCMQAQNREFDHSKFDALLQKYVDETGMVNYDGFKSNKDFNDYLKSIENADLKNFSDNEKLSFYINAYNANVIKNVLNHLPINSPMDVDGFFNKIKHRIAGKEVTLDELEHKYTLKIEPVLSHFGLVCAAKSCPKLINKAYNSKTVFHQLEENAIIFLNDSEKNRLDKENKILYLSEIFKWFKKSFIKKYGSLKNTAINFLNNDDALFLQKSEVEIKFNKYNWQLNSQ